MKNNSFHQQKNPYAHLKDQELLNQTLNAARVEKEATLALLEYLLEVDKRKLYAIKPCGSLFDYIVKELGLSEPAASERVSAVRLMRSVPEVKLHLEAGNLNLTNAAQIQRFIKTEKRANPKSKPLSFTEKTAVIDACLNQSKREVEKILFSKQSGPARILAQEKIKLIASDRSEIKFSVHETTLQKLNLLKDLIGEQSLEHLFDQALDALLLQKRKEKGMTPKPQAKPKKAVLSTQSSPIQPSQTQSMKAPPPQTRPETQALQNHSPQTQPAGFVRSSADSKVNPDSRFVPIDVKRMIFNRSKGQCEYRDPKTSKRCASRYRLQVDHIHPFALGGKTEASNLRHLCQTHNLRQAKQWGLALNPEDKGFH